MSRILLSRTATKAIGTLGNLKAVDPLLVALNDDDWQVRDAAAGALGKLGDARAVGPLVAAYMNGDTDTAAALCAIGEASILPVASALGPKDRAFREKAAPGFMPLLDIAKSPKDRVILAIALCEFGWALSDREAALEPLIAALNAADPRIRVKAVEALGSIRGDRSVSAVTKALLNDNNTDVARAAVKVLGYSPDPRAADALASVPPAHPAYSWAAKVLIDNGDVRAIEFVARQINHVSYVDKEVGDSMKSIHSRHGPRALDQLVSALRAPDLKRVWHSVRALRFLGWRPETADERAIVAISDREFDKAAQEGNVAVMPLVSVLQDKSHEMDGSRSEAVKLLGTLKDGRAVEPLIAALRDDDYKVRWESAKALELIADPRSVDPLLDALEKMNPEEKGNWPGWNVVEAVLKIDGARAVAALQSMILCQFRWSEPAAKHVQSLLENRASEINLDDLRALITLPDIVTLTMSDIDYEGGRGYEEWHQRTNCAAILQLARRELERRGISP